MYVSLVPKINVLFLNNNKNINLKKEEFFIQRYFKKSQFKI